MNEKRQIEIFSAGCPLCQNVIDLVNRMACASCEISVLNMNDSKVAERANKLGVGAAPAVTVNGNLVECCVGRSVDENALQTAGIGQPLE